MKSWIKKIVELVEILGDFKYKALILLMLILMSAVTDGFGMALILPTLDVVMKGGTSGRWEPFLNSWIRPYIPEGYLLFGILVFFLVILVLKNAFVIYTTIYTSSFTQSLRRDWMNRINRNYMHAEFSHITDQRHGYLLNNIIQEPAKAASSIQNMVNFFAHFMLVAVLYAVLFASNWRATLFITIISGAIILSTNKIRSGAASRFGRERMRLDQDLNTKMSENLSAFRQIKTFSLVDHFSEKFDQALRRLIKITIKFNVVKILPNCIGEVISAGTLILVVVYLQFFKGLAVKDIIPLLGLFVVVSYRIGQYLVKIVTQRMLIQSFIPSLKLVHEISRNEPSPSIGSDERVFKVLEGDIVVGDLSFSHAKKEVFNNLSITIPKGKMTAIKGPSGIGKSTIADILLGLLTDYQGCILVNGNDLKKYDMTSWRDKIGFVSQDVFVFNTTIAENIEYGKLGATDTEVIDAAKKAEAHEFIMSLPDGYQTIVGDRGYKLSGGQRQRIALARAIIRDPEIYIFDEATSALDSETEKAVQNSIDSFSKKKTVLIIAHRLSTIRKADVVYDLEEILKEQHKTEKQKESTTI